MPEIGQLKEKIKVAEAAVQDIADETLRTKAFEVVLNNLLAVASTEKAKSSEATRTESHNLADNEETAFDTARLVENAGINMDDLSRVIDFTSDNFHIIANVPGDNEGDKQRNAALILLTANFYCRNQREMLSMDLRDAMKDLCISSLVNMATNLGVKSNKIYLRREGIQGSKNTKYIVTTPGIQKGLELIRSLAKGDAS